MDGKDHQENQDHEERRTGKMMFLSSVENIPEETSVVTKAMQQINGSVCFFFSQIITAEILH